MQQQIGANGKKPAMQRDVDTHSFLVELGRRVRSARARCGMSRKAVSELSGVSPRYIAQLESGEGNVSVVLLRQIGLAIDAPLEQLLSDRPRESPEISDILKSLGSASAFELARVRAVLGVEPVQDSQSNRYALIGLRCADKSTLGRDVADELGYPFIDLKAEIERIGGLTVAEIIAHYGQEGLRRLGRSALERIAEEHKDVVVAVAGGLVAEPEAFDLLLHRFTAVWLRASSKDHIDRIAATWEERSVVGNPAAFKALQDVLTGHEELYAQAPISIDTSGKSDAENRAELIAAIRCHRCGAIEVDGDTQHLSDPAPESTN